MKLYLIEEINSNDFDFLVLKLTHESIFDFIEDLEAELSIKEGTILLDQLFSSGNNVNRFIKLPVKENKIIFDLAEEIEADNEIRRQSVKLLKQNLVNVETSILNDYEKELIRKEIAF